MQADNKLDLRNVAAPFCFLICKANLASMQPGAVLEVHIRNPEIIEDLLTILTRSGERVVATVQSDECTRLWVQKGCGLAETDCHICSTKGENRCPT